MQSRPNQGPAAILGAKTAKDAEKREQLMWMCLQLSVSSFDPNSSTTTNDNIITRAQAMYDHMTKESE
jgi:hypothetical protein